MLGLAAVGSPAAADDEGRGGGPARDTEADYTPFRSFQPLPTSAPCAAAPRADPFVLPPGYDQTVLAQEGDGGTIDLWDMNTQNETGRDAGRYVYKTHETGTGGQVSVTDLTTGSTTVLAQRADWERFDGIAWTPWGTLLAAEEVTTAAVRDPAVPEATAGLVYEFFVDPANPAVLRRDDPRDTVAPFDDGVAARPAVGSRSHEGLRFDRHGNLYGISESNPGALFRFEPDRRGDLSAGTLSALRTDNGHDGPGTWVEIPDATAPINSQAATLAAGANGYNRPEDIETGESTGRDRNNGGNTLYVAITGTDEVLAVDLSSQRNPVAYHYVQNAPHGGTTGSPNVSAEFDSPDNLALDRQGNLAITEDTAGGDIWIAAPPREGRHQQASTVQRFATLIDCAAEPTGIYFAMKGTERWVDGTAREGLVTDETLFVNRQHAGSGTTRDQLIAITPVDDDDRDDGR